MHAFSSLGCSLKSEHAASTQFGYSGLLSLSIYLSLSSLSTSPSAGVASSSSSLRRMHSAKLASASAATQTDNQRYSLSFPFFLFLSNASLYCLFLACSISSCPSYWCHQLSPFLLSLSLIKLTLILLQCTSNISDSSFTCFITAFRSALHASHSLITDREKNQLNQLTICIVWLHKVNGAFTLETQRE